jgi:hypothetical protein
MNESRLQKLIEAHLENQLTADEAAELSDMLTSSPEARQFFWRQASMHGMLQRAVQLEWLGLAHRENLGTGGVVEPVRRHWYSVPNWGWASLATAAVFTVALWFASSNRDVSPEPVRTLTGDTTELEASVRGVATVARLAGVQWNDPASAPVVGSVLAPGWIRFKAGLVQLEFFSGASVIVEGPAEFEIRSEKEAFCQFGRFSASVPEPARGFVVSAPAVALVDLGTSFGMEVARSGEGEVFVYKGLVRLTRTGLQAVQRDLLEGQGVRIDAAGQVRSVSAPAANYTTVSELARLQQGETRLRLAEWREADSDLNRDRSLLVRFDFEEHAQDERILRNRAPNSAASAAGTLVGCQWSNGRWPDKGALEFKGVGDRVRLMVPGEMDALTFSAWVRADSLSHRYNALLVADSYRRGVVRWQLTQQGQLALTQLLVDDDSLADPASTQRVISAPAIPLERMGLWVHVVSVVDFRTGVVAHYVDGKPVGSGKFAKLVPGKLGSVELGNWGIAPETEKGRRLAGGGYLDRSFVGKIDEFALFSRALSSDEIQRLFLQGRVDAGKPQNLAIAEPTRP